MGPPAEDCERNHMGFITAPWVPERCGNCGHNKFYDDPNPVMRTRNYICEACGRVYRQPDKVMEALDEAKRKGIKFQFWWWGYLFRNPDLILILICWAITVGILLTARPAPTLLGTAGAWLIRSIFASFGPVLSLLFVRKKKSGMKMFAGWKSAWAADLRPVYLTAAGVSALLLILMLSRSSAL
jgi:hypothetical protein